MSDGKTKQEENIEQEKKIKLKFSVGNSAIELDGDWTEVNDIIDTLGLKEILHKNSDYLRNFDTYEKDGETESTGDSFYSDLARKDNSYESLGNVVFKKLCGPEVEWVLIYGFYASEFGKGTFTREDVFSKYEETGRDNPSRRRNLTNNLKSMVKHNWLEVLNQKEFKLTARGIKMVEKILDRKGPP